MSLRFSESEIVSVESPWWVPGAERVCSSQSERMPGGGISEGEVEIEERRAVSEICTAK